MMKRLILGLSITALLVATLSAQNIQVDQPDVCLVCHSDFEDLNSLPHVHTAFSDGQCSNCHNPHASRHAALLDEDKTQLCLTCHEDILSHDAGNLAHAPVESGACLDCHDPHASNHPNQLKYSSEELCVLCHSTVSEWFGQANIHPPIEDDCLSCHSAHEGTKPGVLNSVVPTLCFECHDQDETFRLAHSGYELGEANCVTCHDPHASSLEPLLRPNQHSPFKAKKCSVCHVDDNGASFALRDKVDNLCFRCHSGIKKDFSGEHGHNFSDQEKCLHCHNPHSSSEPSLLAGEQTIICVKCHFQDSNYAGMPREQILTHDAMECSTCHQPHGSETPSFLVDNNIDLCGGCHERAHSTSHPFGPDIIDPRSEEPITCLSCHKLHGAAFKPYLPLSSEMDLCIQCHRQ